MDCLSWWAYRIVTHKEIAAELVQCVEQTVKQHRGRITRKLGARSVADLVRLAEHASRISPR